MLLRRYYSWTSAPSLSVSGVPFGPLAARFRGWTDQTVVSTGVPFGPLAARFRGWTTAVLPPLLPWGPLYARYRGWGVGPFVPPVIPPVSPVIGGVRLPRLVFPPDRLRLLREEEDVIALIVAWLQATDGGRP